MSLVCQSSTETPKQQGFISPFGSEQCYSLEWAKVSNRTTVRTNRPLDWVTEQVKQLLMVLNEVKIMSRDQIIKTFWPCPKGKKGSVVKRLDKLVSFGALTPHALRGRYKNIVIYTLGPVGCYILEELYRPNWWHDLTIDTVLKQLIANQFYLRVYRNMPASKYLVGLYPFTGVVYITNVNGNTNEFPLIITRRDAQDIARELKWTPYERAIFICEDVADIELLKPKTLADLNENRYTTDHNLCMTPLRTAFYKYKAIVDENNQPTGETELVEEYIGLFPEDA